MASRRTVRWRGPAVGLAVAVSVGLAGCASVPDAGPPVTVSSPAPTPSEPPVGDAENALLPRPGSDAQESLSAYLTATQYTQDKARLGDLFLAPAAQDAFTQRRAVYIVRRPQAVVTRGTGDQADAVFSGPLVGEVDGATGVYTARNDRPWSVPVRMTKVGDVWLFTQPPPIVVREDYFARALTPITLYFAGVQAEGGTEVLVPDRRYVPPDTAQTDIVNLLLGGPSAAIDAVARNPLPKDTKLDGRVILDDGDLVVELTADAESATSDVIDAFAAMVAWSLRGQLTGDVRLLVNGRPIEVVGVAPVQGEEEWGPYNPYARMAPPRYQVTRGALVLAEAGAEATAGPDLKKPALRSGVVTAGIPLDLSAIAAVKTAPAGRRLWFSDLGSVAPGVTGRVMGRPSWGHDAVDVLVPIDGALYVVSKTRPGVKQRVAVAGAVGPIRAAEVAADGLRVAVVAGDGPAARAQVGVLVPPANPQAAPTVAIRSTLTPAGQARDVSWHGPTGVAVAVADPATGDTGVVLTAIDGSETTVGPTVAGGAGPVRVAAEQVLNPSTTIWLEADGELYQVPTGGAAPTTGTRGSGSPFYPG